MFVASTQSRAAASNSSLPMFISRWLWKYDLLYSICFLYSQNKVQSWFWLGPELVWSSESYFCLDCALSLTCIRQPNNNPALFAHPIPATWFILSQHSRATTWAEPSALHQYSQHKGSNSIGYWLGICHFQCLHYLVAESICWSLMDSGLLIHGSLLYVPSCICLREERQVRIDAAVQVVYTRLRWRIVSEELLQLLKDLLPTYGEVEQLCVCFVLL